MLRTVTEIRGRGVGLSVMPLRNADKIYVAHKKQKATPSDIPSEPPSKQSAETVQPPRLGPQRVAAWRQKELLCPFQFQELESMELDDVDTEGLVILPVLSIKSGTPTIENSEAIWSEE